MANNPDLDHHRIFSGDIEKLPIVMDINGFNYLGVVPTSGGVQTGISFAALSSYGLAKKVFIPMGIGGYVGRHYDGGHEGDLVKLVRDNMVGTDPRYTQTRHEYTLHNPNSLDYEAFIRESLENSPSGMTLFATLPVMMVIALSNYFKNASRVEKKDGNSYISGNYGHYDQPINIFKSTELRSR